MGKAVEYGLWANQLAVVSAFSAIAGAWCTIFIPFPNKWVAFYAFATSHITLLFEYARPKRELGRNIPRKGQFALQKFIFKYFKVWESYLFRSVVYTSVAAPLFFELPCAFASLFYLITSVVYMIGHFHGEKFMYIEDRKYTQKKKVFEVNQLHRKIHDIDDTEKLDLIRSVYNEKKLSV